jgi:long-chain acyl-CoA synthetase
MLYERWREVVREHSPAIALHELSSGRRWTFAQLSVVAEEDLHAPTSRCVHPQGSSAEFIFAVLRAWRDRKVVCPLELDQAPPSWMTAKFPDGCAHIKLTSATTGEARGVAFSAPQLLADARNIVTTMGLRRDWPNLGVISLAHSYGFSNLVLPLLLHGIPLILGQSPLPETIRQGATAAEFVVLPGVPALWRAWLEAKAIPPNVKRAISAGAPLPISLESAIFEQTGLKVHNFYGSTECGGIAFDRASTPRTDPACVGTPLENVKLRVAGDGCLEVFSAAVGQTYWPERDERLQAGCFHTSDLAEIIGGKVFLRGRATDQINVAGRKISPEVIERVICSHPAVSECLVFGVPSESPERGEEIVVCVVDRSPISIRELKHFVSGQLASWQTPRDWWLVPSLQPNPRGKLSRSEWRERFLAHKRNGGKRA